jgi:hypothetical protein
MVLIGDHAVNLCCVLFGIILNITGVGSAVPDDRESVNQRALDNIMQLISSQISLEKKSQQMEVCMRLQPFTGLFCERKPGLHTTARVCRATIGTEHCSAWKTLS